MDNNKNAVAELRAIATEMRERKVGHRGNQSPTLVAWANRIDAAIASDVEVSGVVCMHNEDLTSERGTGEPNPSHGGQTYPRLSDLPPPPVATGRAR